MVGARLQCLTLVFSMTPLIVLLRVTPGLAFSSRYRPSQQALKRIVRFAEPPLPPQAVGSLLRSALSRAKRTIAEKNEWFDKANGQKSGGDTAEADALFSFADEGSQFRSEAASDLLSGIASRAQRTLSTKSFSTETEQPIAVEAAKSTTKVTTATPKKDFTPNDLRYSQNPAISLTALAHWLWSSVLRPHEDSAIDATCGNGHDSVGIASILFANEDLYLDRQSELVCVDVQEQACQATEDALSEVLYSSTLSRQVQILNQSHAPLPIPQNGSSVGLVVYNLGYLPNSPQEIQTQVESTLESITDALLLIRLGGMVSVMTYPRTNREEDFAVRTLLEATVVMTNKRGPKWFEVVDALDCTTEMKALLTSKLRRISTCYEQNGNQKRTFRVTEHKKIGLSQAPILITATRIK